MTHKKFTWAVLALLILFGFSGNSVSARVGLPLVETTANQVFLSFLTRQVQSAPDFNGGGLKAFPGAMGFGANAIGGRSGRVIYVTNLNDAGAGSLRAALTAKGPRTILFKVSGTITLNSDLVISKPYVTVAGQSAPGEGIQIRGGQLKIRTHNVIIRYLKVRSGDLVTNSSNQDRDAANITHETAAHNIIIDHATLIWGPDVGGITVLNGARDVTISYSIIGEGLFVSKHEEGNLLEAGHSMGMNIAELSAAYHPARITIHHNLLTSSSERNPRIIGGENIDFVNNVVYNWMDSPSQGNPRSLNLINNTYILGPMSTKPKMWVAWLPNIESGALLRAGSVFESGNQTEGFSTVRGGASSVYAAERFAPYSMAAEVSAEAAYQQIVQEAGASRQVGGADGAFRFVRDVVDQRILDNLVNRSGTFVNGVEFDLVGGYPAIAWPVLASGAPATDGDGDGMPEAWEQLHFGGSSRGSPANSSGDFDGDGYTDLEEYLNGSDPLNP